MTGRNREGYWIPQGEGSWNIPGIGSGNPQVRVFDTRRKGQLHMHGGESFTGAG